MMVGVMKCKEINFIQYIEGIAPREVISHVKTCKTCREKSERFQKFSHFIATGYQEGKKLNGELEELLKNIDSLRMKKLPEPLVEKVASLREKSVVAKVRKLLGKEKGKAEEFVRSLLTMQPQAMPASPRDITKTRKTAKKKKAAGKKKN